MFAKYVLPQCLMHLPVALGALSHRWSGPNGVMAYKSQNGGGIESLRACDMLTSFYNSVF